MEPTKHQYDYDVATVHGFLLKYGLANEVKVNVAANHATLAAHSFEHEISIAASLGILGSIDIKRGDPQDGWDTNQFPANAQDQSLALLEVVRAGGLGSGSFKFDANVRWQSIDPEDLCHAHICGLAVLAAALLIAESIIVDGRLQRFRDERYADWKSAFGKSILDGKQSLVDLSQFVVSRDVNPVPRSGRGQIYENLVQRLVQVAGR